MQPSHKISPFSILQACFSKRNELSCMPALWLSRSTHPWKNKPTPDERPGLITAVFTQAANETRVFLRDILSRGVQIRQGTYYIMKFQPYRRPWSL